MSGSCRKEVRLRSLEREGEHQRSRSLFGAGCIWSWSQCPFSHKCSGLHSVRRRSHGSQIHSELHSSVTSAHNLGSEPREGNSVFSMFLHKLSEAEISRVDTATFDESLTVPPSQPRLSNLFLLRSGSTTDPTYHTETKRPSTGLYLLKVPGDSDTVVV